MEKYMEVLEKCPLFDGIARKELSSMLGCLSAEKRAFDKNEFIYLAGDSVGTLGVVLSGSVHILLEDFWGNRTILAVASPGELFAEAFSCAEVQSLPVSVLSVQASDVLLIDYRKIITTCPSACGYHTRLIENMLKILAVKNVLLTQKLEILSYRTTREKLLRYLSSQALRADARSFEIPFNRQELSEFLSVDRSAMCSELSRMQRDGILKYERNRFELL